MCAAIALSLSTTITDHWTAIAVGRVTAAVNSTVKNVSKNG